MTSAASVLRRARKRAGLAQADLAARLGTKQPVVARWESGARRPSFDDVVRAVSACGLHLDAIVGEPDPGEDALLREWLELSPAERLRRNEQMLATEEWALRAGSRGKRNVDARR